MLIINDKLQKDNAAYLVLVGLGHQIAQLLSINVELINPHKQMHLAFDYKGKNYNIYAEKNSLSSVLQTKARFNCFGDTRYFQDYTGVQVLEYFRAIHNKIKFNPSKVYVRKYNERIYKLHEVSYIDEMEYAWIGLSDSCSWCDGKWPSGQAAIDNAEKVIALDNQNALIQWLYINK